MQARTLDAAQLFWSAMLPVTWAACWTLSSIGSAMASRGVPTDNKALQSVIYLAIVLGLIGMIALRQLIVHGITAGRWPRVALLMTVLVAMSVIATRYGMTWA